VELRELMLPPVAAKLLYEMGLPGADFVRSDEETGDNIAVDIRVGLIGRFDDGDSPGRVSGRDKLPELKLRDGSE
jgi:hypothetical protein